MYDTRPLSIKFAYYIIIAYCTVAVHCNCILCIRSISQSYRILVHQPKDRVFAKSMAFKEVNLQFDIRVKTICMDLEQRCHFVSWHIAIGVVCVFCQIVGVDGLDQNKITRQLADKSVDVGCLLVTFTRSKLI